MKKIKSVLNLICVIIITAFATSVFAEWEIKPKYFDIYPNDGIMDKGTSSNPYVIEDSWGRTKATIKPKYFDLYPNDGIMDSGTSSNPYVIDWN